MTTTTMRRPIARASRHLGAAMALCVALLLAMPAAAAAKPPLPLAPAVAATHTLAPGSVDVFHLELAAPGAYLLTVEQRDLDVAVRVDGPDGQTLLAVDSPLDRRGREFALIEAAAAGRYRVTVRAREPHGAVGDYVIRCGLRETDPRRRRAARFTTDAARLYHRADGRDPDTWRQAIDAGWLAFAAALAAHEPRWATRALYVNAVLHRLLDDYRPARALAQQTLPFFLADGDAVFAANAWNEIGLASWLLGDVSAARASFERARQLHAQVRHDWGVAVSAANLCLIDLAEGALRAGAACHARVLPQLEAVRALDLAGTVASNAGHTWNLLGEPERALAHYRSALALSQTLGDRPLQARVHNNLGVLHRQLGDYPRALAAFDQALVIFRARGQRRWQAHVLGNVGATYQALGRRARARTHHRQALALWREIGHRSGEANTLVNLALADRRDGRPEAAAAGLRRALDIWRASGDPRREAQVRAHLGRLDLDRDDGDAARMQLLRATAIFAHVGDLLGAIDAAIDLGIAHDRRGEPARARMRLHDALARARALPHPAARLRGRLALARVERRAGAPARARHHVETAIEIVETERVKIGPPTLRASFFGVFRDLYDLHVDLLLDAGDARGALVAAERARARTLRELRDRAAGAAPAVAAASPQRAQRRRLLQRLDAKTARTVDPATPSSRRLALSAEQADILRQLDVMEMARASGPATATDTATTVDAVQRRLDADTVLLVYALGATRSVVWRIDRATVTVHPLPPRRQIERLARQVHDGLRHFDPARRADERAAAAQLAAWILGPIADDLDAPRLVVVPDGALAYVPFAVLPAPDDARIRLIDRHEIRYLPAASMLRASASSARRDGAVAVIADPVFARDDPRLGRRIDRAASVPADGLMPRFARLPGSRREAERIGALADGRAVRHLVDFDAHRGAVADANLDAYAFIHFATHGVLDARTPALSGLALSAWDADGRPRSGLLRLHDLYAMRLDAELVVLSGCRTALGAEMRGEGLWGLTSGFLSAGARRVVASLWPVEDRASAALMDHFYTALWRDGQPPAAALRTAKRALRRERRWRDPYFWAPFVLQGDG
ncbi:MAG: CHAT domain-containing tetratricopeptide repeat protein [Acidobacteriota bacterium]